MSWFPVIFGSSNARFGHFNSPNDLLLARLRTDEIPPYLCYFHVIWTWTHTLTRRRPHGTLFRPGGVGTVIFG